MLPPALSSAIARVPPGAWGVGVSGGADSVALICLLLERHDLLLHVVHLDHQTRGADSTADADFVRDLAARFALPITVALLSDIETTTPRLPANDSSRYRAARHALFARAVAEHRLAGIILAHHADDQAETVLHRLLRGSGPAGLAAMQPTTEIASLKILRPLLDVRQGDLRRFLSDLGQPWREDASNQSDKYFRNRLRGVLRQEPSIAKDLLELGEACHSLRDWSRHAAPTLPTVFPASQLADLPPLLATESARRWLIERDIPPADLSPAVIHRLTLMAGDAGITSANFPGGICVRRKKGMIRVS